MYSGLPLQVRGMRMPVHMLRQDLDQGWVKEGTRVESGKEKRGGEEDRTRTHVGPPIVAGPSDRGPGGPVAAAAAMPVGIQTITRKA